MTERGEHTPGMVERLRAQAASASEIKRSMAEAKSLRQSDNPEGRTDLYMWPTPEQTLEGQAADLISELVGALGTIRHLWAGHAEECAYVQDYDNKCDCDWLKIAAQCDAALAKARGGAE